MIAAANRIRGAATHTVVVATMSQRQTMFNVRELRTRSFAARRPERAVNGLTQFAAVFRLCAVAALVLICSNTLAALPQEPVRQYAAGWADGQQTFAAEILQWHGSPANPSMSDRALFNPANPVRWIRLLDPQQKLAAPAGPRVEFTGGDVLPGLVVSGHRELESAQQSLPAYLEVSVRVSVNFPGTPPRETIRVLQTPVRRIVFTELDLPAIPAGTAALKSGRRIAFRRCQFAGDAVRLLTEGSAAASDAAGKPTEKSPLNKKQSGKTPPAGITPNDAPGTSSAAVQTVPLAELAEIRFPDNEFWTDLVDTWSVLCPEGAGQIIRIETQDGLRATTSQTRFQARGLGDVGNPDNWIEVIRPAWCIDSLYIKHRNVTGWQFFEANQLPLSLLTPSRSEHRGMFSDSWNRAQTDRNVQGGLMSCGGRWWGWGFGVHASHDLEFTLPGVPTRFRTAFGIDGLAGTGGCVRATILDGTTHLAPATWQTPIVGSQQFAACEWVNLPAGPRGTLRLSVDMVAEPATESSAGTKGITVDPLDIRDLADWLEPELQLPADWMRDQIRTRSRQMHGLLGGWKMSGELGKDWSLRNMVDGQAQPYPTVQLILLPHPGPVTFDRTLRVTADRPFLAIPIFRTLEDTASCRVDVRINNEAYIQTYLQTADQIARQPQLIDLTGFVGRDVAIQIKLVPDNDHSYAVWRVPQLSSKVPNADIMRK